MARAVIGAQVPRKDALTLSGDIEGSTFEIGTTSIRLVRAGNVLQAWFSNKWEAKYLYRELAAKYKTAEDEFRRS